MTEECFAKELMADLKPHLLKLDLKGFAGMALVDMSNTSAIARVVDGRVEINRQYFSEKAALAMNGDTVAYSELLNTVHHELCHIDIENRMPILICELAKEEIFPLGIAFRFTREFLACLGSIETLSVESLKNVIVHGTQEINRLSSKRDITDYCDIVCDLAYLVGDCIHAPCGYFASMCDAIEDDMLVRLARQFLSIMSDIEDRLPIKAERDLFPLRDAIFFGWLQYKNPSDIKENAEYRDLLMKSLV